MAFASTFIIPILHSIYPYVMKNLLHTTFIVLLAMSISAQSRVDKSVIYANDGSVYIGEIISENALDIKMVIGTMDTINLDKRYIKKMNNPPEHIVMYEKGKYHKTGGLFLSLQLLSGFTDDDNATVNFSIISGKRLNAKWQVGLGYGVTANTVRLPGDFWADHEFQNVFAYGRYNIKQSKVMLFADSALGYGIAASGARWSGDYTSGVYFQPGIGIEFANRKKLKWSIKLSQYVQPTSGLINLETNFGTPGIYEYKLIYNRTLLGVGMTF